MLQKKICKIHIPVVHTRFAAPTSQGYIQGPSRQVVHGDHLEARDRSQVQSHSGVRHFKNGISTVSQWTGSEHKEMEKICPRLISAGAHPEMVKAVRGLIDFAYFASLQSDTSETLLGLRNTFDTFHAHKQIFIELGASISPKFTPSTTGTRHCKCPTRPAYDRYIKEEITTAFSLKRRSKTHTSPHLRNELHLLLTMFKEQEGAAVHQFARGTQRLEGGKLQEWLDRSMCLGAFLEELNRPHDIPAETSSPEPAPIHEDSSSDSDSEHNSSPPLSPRSSSPFHSHSTRPPSSSSTGSTRSEQAYASITRSGERFIDPNEPDDDDEDLSNSKLSSGSYTTAYVDQTTGTLEYDEEVELDDPEGTAEDQQDGEDDEDELEEEDGSAYFHSDREVESDMD
ncbi:hypothetical protein B0H14DRAFT_2564360 [Mycena olivaceomarginata]|nr:hypothetical protein B0H14DRAFT_2564360 [Mycena olivaceomarginata]